MSPLSHAELITITGGTRESNPLFERFEKTYHNVVFRMYVVLFAILGLLGTHLFAFPTLLNPFMFIALSVYTLMGFLNCWMFYGRTWKNIAIYFDVNCN